MSTTLDYRTEYTPRVEAQKALIDKSTEITEDVIVPRRRDPHTKWKTTLIIGITLATLVLATNIGVLVWAKTFSLTEDGIATVFTGSCLVMERMVISAELVINILSTLLLAASNFTAQLLSAPSRKDVDRQHGRGRWLDIGVSSVRNLWHLPRWRLAIWVLIVASTVPLHLLYNSVVFSSHAVNDYQAALVTEDFVHGGWWNRTAAETVLDANVDQLSQLATREKQLTKMDTALCIDQFGTKMYGDSYRNVLVVTSLATANSSLINVYFHTGAGKVPDLNWMCHGDVHNLYAPEYPPCDTDTMMATEWTIPKVPACPQSQETRLGYSRNLVDGSDNCDAFYDAPIEYCLAEEFFAPCTTSISTRLLAVVIVCNVVKILCMLAVLFARDFRPLSTIGDAIASFMDNPDPTTTNKGALEVATVTSGVLQRLDRYPPTPWTKQKRPWWYAIPRAQLWLTLLVCFIPWLITVIIVARLAMSPDKNNFLSFGTQETNNFVNFPTDGGLIANVVLANTPQIIITFVYIFYNDAFTRMALNLEYLQFATKRKSLRVSRPHGHQRSTYWLQLPFRYSIPIGLCMVLLHWLVSRSLFLVRITVYDSAGVHDPDRNVNTCGISPLAIVFALCLSTVMIAALVILGRFRHFQASMPVASSCSMAISAAVHPPESEPVHAAFMPVQYGVIPGSGSNDAWWSASQYDGAFEMTSTRHRPEHVTFSSKMVDPLESGTIYR